MDLFYKLKIKWHNKWVFEDDKEKKGLIFGSKARVSRKGYTMRICDIANNKSCQCQLQTDAI